MRVCTFTRTHVNRSGSCVVCVWRAKKPSTSDVYRWLGVGWAIDLLSQPLLVLRLISKRYLFAQILNQQIREGNEKNLPPLSITFWLAALCVCVWIAAISKLDLSMPCCVCVCLVSSGREWKKKKRKLKKENNEPIYLSDKKKKGSKNQFHLQNLHMDANNLNPPSVACPQERIRSPPLHSNPKKV